MRKLHVKAQEGEMVVEGKDAALKLRLWLVQQMEAGTLHGVEIGPNRIEFDTPNGITGSYVIIGEKRQKLEYVTKAELIEAFVGMAMNDGVHWSD